MNLENYKYRGARAMVILHEKHLRSCVDVWKEAKKKVIKLPQTEDRDYQSLEHLIHHVLRAARGYMIWMCDKLGLPDPDIKAAPELDQIENEIDGYLSYLLEKWKSPLANVEEEKFFDVHLSNWKVEYCIDAMLEHAVMHPIRHEFQIQELMEKQGLSAS